MYKYICKCIHIYVIVYIYMHYESLGKTKFLVILWTKWHDDSLQKVKKAICTASGCTASNIQAPFTIFTDTSKFALDPVLLKTKKNKLSYLLSLQTKNCQNRKKSMLLWKKETYTHFLCSQKI